MQETQHAEDVFFMHGALRLAQQAADADEVPVGALLVQDGEIIGRGYNQPVCSHDPSAHAEICALRDAGQRLSNYRMPGATLYVTIEPCTMCYGAIIHARIKRLVFGAPEPRYGAVISGQKLLEKGQFNHRPEVLGGVLEADCAALMKDFFARRRGRPARQPGQ